MNKKTCYNCVWLLHFYQEKKVECIKGKFDLTPVADFRARGDCEFWETFGDALARLKAAGERKEA